MPGGQKHKKDANKHTLKLSKTPFANSVIETCRTESVSYNSEVDLGYFSEDIRALIDVLFMEIQPAHLQVFADRKLGAQERDSLRAEIMRDRLKSLPEPSKFLSNKPNEQSPEGD